MRNIAVPNYSNFSKIGGKDAQLIMDTLIKDVSDAKKALGI